MRTAYRIIETFSSGKLLGLFAFLISAAWLAQLIAPAAVERDGALHRELSIEWADARGRLVHQRPLPAELNEETEIGFDPRTTLHSTHWAWDLAQSGQN